MLLANTNIGNRIRATPNTKGTCPHCKEPVISKCGSINIWHWAHKTTCPYETEPMTQWHIDWQELALKNGCDIEVNMESRIADAMKINGDCDIFEFQHSPIKQTELQARCEYYKSLALKINWVFDVRATQNRFSFYIQDGQVHFIWKYSKKSLTSLFSRSIDYDLLVNKKRNKFIEEFGLENIVCFDTTHITELYLPSYGNIYLDIGYAKYTEYRPIERYIIWSDKYLFKIQSINHKNSVEFGKGIFVLKEDIFK